MDLLITIKNAPLDASDFIGRQFFAKDGNCSFGRSSSNDMVLPDESRHVSAKHGIIRTEKSYILLLDKSTNGIRLKGNKEKLGKGQQVILQHGSQLLFGQYLLEIDTKNPDHYQQAFSGWITHNSQPSQRLSPAVSQAASNKADQNSRDDSDVAIQLALKLGLQGISDDKLDVIPDDLVEVVRQCVKGAMEVLSSRREIKTRMHLENTHIKNLDNNPLKFSASVDDAIKTMFMKSGVEYLSASQSVEDAFKDISNHQLSMMAAMTQAYQEMLNSLNPNEIEKSVNTQDGKLFQKKADYWEIYKKRYQRLEEQQEGGFNSAFISAFSNAYKQQMLDRRKQPD